MEEKIIKESKTFVGKLIIAIVAAVLGAIAGSMYEARHTENAIVEKMAAELSMIDKNKSLAQAIDDIKVDNDLKDKEITKYKTEIIDLEERISGGGDHISELENELSIMKAKLEDKEKQLADFSFETPKLYIDGESASTDENAILRFKDQVYYGNSILHHFFEESKIKYENGRLEMSTDGGRVVVQPLLSNGSDLTRMEVIHPDSYIKVGALVDNEGNKHNSSIYTTGNKQYIEYRLDKHYKYFECCAFVTNDALKISDSDNVWDTATVTITSNNGLYLWGTDKISPHATVQKSGLIDISGSTYIRIEFSDCSRYYTPIMGIGEARLYTE